jgi:hypothetical protein
MGAARDKGAGEDALAVFAELARRLRPDAPEDEVRALAEDVWLRQHGVITQAMVAGEIRAYRRCAALAAGHSTTREMLAAMFERWAEEAAG